MLKNWKTPSGLPALVIATTLCLPTTASALTVNQVNGNLFITMEPNDSYALARNASVAVCEDGSRAIVAEAYDENFEQEHIQTYCGVENIRIAGLSGQNAAVVGGFGEGLTITGTLDVRGGPNKDTLIFDGDVEVGKLIVTLRGGNNRIRAAANEYMVEFGGAAFIPFTSNSLTVHGTMDIDTNSGNDIANFRALTVGNIADINLGGGNDTSNIYGGGGPNDVHRLFMRLGNGDNVGSIRNTTCRVCQVFGGGGQDDIFIKNVSAELDVDAIAGAGDDTVELKNVTSTSTDVNASGGPGDDCLIDDDSATTDSGFEGCTDS